MCASCRAILLAVAALLAFSSSAAAAPWDWDMSKQQSFRSNEMAREPAKGTVPLGYKPFPYSSNDEAGEKLKNPVKSDTDSLARGRRLWASNCATCHGITGEADGPVAAFLTVPNITEGFYKSRPDGRIYGVIHNGQNQMPRYGYKFSSAEKWDLVNYVRKLQGAAGESSAQ